MWNMQNKCSEQNADLCLLGSRGIEYLMVIRDFLGGLMKIFWNYIEVVSTYHECIKYSWEFYLKWLILYYMNLISNKS